MCISLKLPRRSCRRRVTPACRSSARRVLQETDFCFNLVQLVACSAVRFERFRPRRSRVSPSCSSADRRRADVAEAFSTTFWKCRRSTPAPPQRFGRHAVSAVAVAVAAAPARSSWPLRRGARLTPQRNNDERLPAPSPRRARGCRRSARTTDAAPLTLFCADPARHCCHTLSSAFACPSPRRPAKTRCRSSRRPAAVAHSRSARDRARIGPRCRRRAHESLSGSSQASVNPTVRAWRAAAGGLVHVPRRALAMPIAATTSRCSRPPRH